MGLSQTKFAWRRCLHSDVALGVSKMVHESDCKRIVAEDLFTYIDDIQTCGQSDQHGREVS
jgi:hypothetical protein